MKMLLVLLLLAATSLRAQTVWGRYIHSFTLQCADQDSLSGDEQYMTITAGNATVSGTTNKVFVVRPCSCEVVVDTLIYAAFVTSKTFTLTFRCTDSAGAYTSQKRKVVLRKSGGKRITSLVTTVL